MKKEEQRTTDAAEANIELNEKMNEDNEISYKKKITSATDANNAIQDRFYGENNEENILPTYLNNNTPAIKINRKD